MIISCQYSTLLKLTLQFNSKKKVKEKEKYIKKEFYY
jgi:hypothetical protein